MMKEAVCYVGLHPGSQLYAYSGTHDIFIQNLSFLIHWWPTPYI